MTAETFFNLPCPNATLHEKSFFLKPEKHAIETNWRTFDDQPPSLASLLDLFAGRISVVREPGFLTPEECNSMLQVVKKHDLGTYDTENTWPRVGVAGITQYDHIRDQSLYFRNVNEARSLQRRWMEACGVDIIQRVADKLREISGMSVEIAREENEEYFAGVLRAVDRGIGVHADFAPYEAAGWAVGKVTAQLTWNILLNSVPGGDTLIYDRQWQAPEDDIAWRKDFPRDSYHPQMLQGHTFKAMEAVPGDLTLFNPRNFHEVKACDTSRAHPDPIIRFTVSSFVGYLPSNEQGETLILWS